jgi:hypothetical protein
MNYLGKMDEECITLCDAMNSLPGIETLESCCGHGKNEYRIWFNAKNNKHLSILLDIINGCHYWNCFVNIDCDMKLFYKLQSRKIGDIAYIEAHDIAENISNYLQSS